MNQGPPNVSDRVVIAKPDIQSVLDLLKQEGYLLIGPTLREEAILYDEIAEMSDLPSGWTDEQGPGSYRVKKRDDEHYFGFVVGPNSWKSYLYPADLKLFSTCKMGDHFEVQAQVQSPPRYAFVGVRACDLAAIKILDRIFIEDAIQDSSYRARRENAFILAVNCTEPGETCFCVSMGTGPECTGDFDLAITELKDTFLIDVGSPLGAFMLHGSTWRLAGALEINRARQLMIAAESSMGRTLDTTGVADLLFNNLDHPRWDDVAMRCLSCANCTLVCPTCFCSDVQDTSDLTCETTQRTRVWDSCFNPDFSYVHGGHVRPNIRSRYRQWLTHKMASWIGQFGTAGCVGCGRCITWCPVGIDLTEEIAAIRGEV